MRWMALLLLVVGCTFSSPRGMADAGGDSSMECQAWDPRGGHVKDLCAMAPAGSWQIGSATATYDTGTGAYSDGPYPRSFLIAQPGDRMLRVVSVDSFEVGPGASLRVVGPHPLLVLSWSTITVAGTIDVSSRAGSPGAGASRQDCDAGDNGQGASEAGGGGGGGLNQVGKGGGNGNAGSTANPGGTSGAAISRPVGVIVGGCRGGDGGGAGGVGGDGGGAVQLTARTSITIAAMGKILAGGMGGAGAQDNGGGGGGGSGGYIGLDAPVVTTAGGSSLAANGGAGGAGCQLGPGAAGADGPITNVAAVGGQGFSCTSGGANGGNGGARGAAAFPGADSLFSGGGGGGGAGFVIIWTPLAGFTRGGILSPLEVHVPDAEMAP